MAGRVMASNKIKLVITGGSGFIGKNILENISRENVEIYFFDKCIPEKIHAQDTFYKVDLKDLVKIEELLEIIRPSHLLHLAWPVKDSNFTESLDNVEWIGISLGLLNAFLKKGGKNFIGAGTCFEYELRNESVLTELSPCIPRTLYGKCKYEFGKIAEKICVENSVRFVWGRIFYPYGLGEESRKLFSTVISSFKNNEKFTCKNPEDIIDYIHISDIAADFVEFILNDEIYGFKNVCTGEGIVIEEAIKFIMEQMQVDLGLYSKENSNFRKYIVGKNIKKRQCFYEKILEMIEVSYGNKMSSL